ncbi:hypothetical protein BAUCODRAFT_76924 [Baudoinia panamericana UAMH 10762]|uniref:Alpha/beta hydrolase fold-3 domain-containing protein n=1 Tax=Baudoinia panamericana (strain UAMH 10762) TaxID=717646 RepID=M2M8B8_BAUPA|nr:uncharacterized protein BAUCODRAFT_76924 [Baudoinia panamericana UAMH 10762]EMC92611.1 hypothetical protein BAUCODRAFT_76924 [Baudoinia panamericana UAMH 10762]
MESPESRTAKQKAQAPRPRWVLHLQATMWRFLMGLGMLFHKLAPPRPPKPSFTRQIPTTISGTKGTVTLYFYVPRDYATQKQLWMDKPNTVNQHIRRRSMSGRRWGGYAVVINFHGGGFTLGTATDDARWCGTVVDECNAVVVSVDYRLAPECPFPTAVEDGVDAVLWMHEHAAELGIDREKIAISGFSSGGNMAFTVPLRLYDEQTGFLRDEPEANPTESTPQQGQRSKRHKPNTTVTKSRDIPDVHIRAIIPWYPSLDYTRTREQRRATTLRKDQELPALFTDLFDESYLHPPHTIELDSPYLSPGVAPTALLKNALPDEIIMNTCEWDMLLDEGEAFRKRLTSEPLNKHVNYHLIEGVPHGWDKAPNPWKPTPGVREHYLRVCKEMRRVFGPQPGVDLREHPTKAGPSAAPRGSISVVR